MKTETKRGFIFAITWINLGWQAVFGLAWGFWLRDLAEARWGVQGATLVQGALILGPTSVVAWVVLRWCKRIGVWP